MLPEFINQENTTAISCRNSFAEIMCEGYHFELKPYINPTDVRSLYYYSSENTLIVSHARHNRVHLLNLETGKLRWFDHHGTSVRSVKVKNDLILTGSWDGSVGLTSIRSLKLLQRLSEKKMGRCPDVIFSPENDFAYSFTYDTDKDPGYVSNTVRKWKVDDGTLEKVIFLPGVHLTGRRCGSCEVFENYLFVASDTGRIGKYDSITGSLIAEESCSELLAAMCILPSSGILAVGSNTGSILICDLNNLKIKYSIKAHSDALNQLILHPGNPEIMISVGFDGMVKIWHLPELELVGSINLNRESLWTVTIINDMLLTGGECGDIQIFDIKNPRDPKLKGTLVISGNSYAYISAGKKSFCSSDLSHISVIKDTGDTVVNDQFSEYLLNTTSDFNALRELFRNEKKDSATTGINSGDFYQLGVKNTIHE